MEEKMASITQMECKVFRCQQVKVCFEWPLDDIYRFMLVERLIIFQLSLFQFLFDRSILINWAPFFLYAPWRFISVFCSQMCCASDCASGQCYTCSLTYSTFDNLFSFLTLTVLVCLLLWLIMSFSVFHLSASTLHKVPESVVSTRDTS